ncbi:tRNA lysidine(34) synthetase TilS [Candidatus Saccharibacteria bacterium]|nr:tRNA lysidine(34) synthetase TilS [Candidatus Saccharibacteria bacterium]
MTYIVAVSGGIDSVVLLDMLCRSEEGREKREACYVVAHVDHGIRDDSHDDALFVGRLAQRYGLVYESTQLRLGARASEESARDARYQFLNEVKKRHKAEAIVTAHHQDDVLETMIINLIRGTGWRGLCSLREHSGMLRPLLTMSKADVVRYAIGHELEWRDDSTNDDPRYLRNYIRHTIMRALQPDQRRELVRLYQSQAVLVDEIDTDIVNHLDQIKINDALPRYWLIMAGEIVSGQVISAWRGKRFQAKSLRRMWHFICTAHPGKQIHEDGTIFCVTARDLIVSPPHI